MGLYEPGLFFSEQRKGFTALGRFESFDDLALIDSSDDAIGKGMDFDLHFGPGDAMRGRRQLEETIVEGEAIVVGDGSGLLVAETSIEVKANR